MNADELYKIVERQLGNFWEIETDNREYMVELTRKSLEKVEKVSVPLKINITYKMDSLHTIRFIIQYFYIICLI